MFIAGAVIVGGAIIMGGHDDHSRHSRYSEYGDADAIRHIEAQEAGVRRAEEKLADIRETAQQSFLENGIEAAVQLKKYLPAEQADMDVDEIGKDPQAYKREIISLLHTQLEMEQKKDEEKLKSVNDIIERINAIQLQKREDKQE